MENCWYVPKNRLYCYLAAEMPLNLVILKCYSWRDTIWRHPLIEGSSITRLIHCDVLQALSFLLHRNLMETQSWRRENAQVDHSFSAGHASYPPSVFCFWRYPALFSSNQIVRRGQSLLPGHWLCWKVCRGWCLTQGEGAFHPIPWRSNRLKAQSLKPDNLLMGFPTKDVPQQEVLCVNSVIA